MSKGFNIIVYAPRDSVVPLFCAHLCTAILVTSNVLNGTRRLVLVEPRLVLHMMK